VIQLRFKSNRDLVYLSLENKQLSNTNLMTCSIEHSPNDNILTLITQSCINRKTHFSSYSQYFVYKL